jgi:hypothetical protein
MQWGTKLLVAAAEEGQTKLVSLLLEKGVDIEATSEVL